MSDTSELSDEWCLQVAVMSVSESEWVSDDVMDSAHEKLENTKHHATAKIEN